MKSSQSMCSILHEISDLEANNSGFKLNSHVKTASADSVQFEALGNQLIALYASTENLRSRELIWDYLDQAGFVWLKKLVTRNTAPLAEPVSLTSLAQYVRHAAANDIGIAEEF